MASPRYLTKSRFKLAVDCPTKLFYHGKSTEYHDTLVENDFLSMLAEGGYQVGALAKLRYPDGIEIEELIHEKAYLQTQEHLQKEHVVLFEPAICVGDFFIRIDVLVKNGDQFELIEVKAKSFNSNNPEMEGKRGDISSGMLPYIQDAAFQTWVLRQAFPSAQVTTALMMPDKAQVAPLDRINQIFKITKNSNVKVNIPPGADMKALADTLLIKVCVDRYVEKVLNQLLSFPGGPAKLSDAAHTWSRAYLNDQRIPPTLGAQCGRCQFNTTPGDTLKSGFRECWKAATDLKDQDFDDGTVLDLWNFRDKQKLIEQGIYKISQIRRSHLGDFTDKPDTDGLNRKQRQWLQLNGIPKDNDHGGYYFDSELAKQKMSGWKFPLHFIDFETSTAALPFYKGMSPYEPVAFQFSHHIMEADGNVRHAGEFLCANPGEFPNFRFAQALKEALEKDEGTIFMWSHHENTILSKIIEQLAKASQLPEGAEALNAFIKRLTKGGDRAMVDLCTIAEKTFFHPDTNGSNSIKKVLPAILKVSDVLRKKYSRPVYGAPGGIHSLNFSSSDGFVWIEAAADGTTSDPYAKLKQLAKSMISDASMDAEGDASVIAEGGAAATAYARLQFEDMDDQSRKRICSALLRYCELDTLAMVMVVQAWQGMCGLILAPEKMGALNEHL
ncbi:MAG: DUF2779 domain-containing protein [Chlorobium sp.]|nr:DUF2779 domain-containing protein [Chlorobium sp.]